MPPEWWALAHTILADMPRLEGALCTGRWQLFDPHLQKDADCDYAEATALCLCGRCPALAACRAWVDSLPVYQRPIGVCAGQVLAPVRGSQPTGRRRGRPKQNYLRP